MERYDLAIIGGGPAGYVSAIRAAQLGMRVVVVEKGRLGGLCLNRGCIPTKALIHATDPLRRIGDLNRIGIRINRNTIDISRLKDFKDRVVKRLVSGIEFLFRKHRIRLINQIAALDGAEKIKAGPEEIISDKIAIATGTSALEIPEIPFDHKTILSSDDLLDLCLIPKRLLVIGAGAVGLEMASIYHNLGSEVVIYEMMDQILPGCDPEMATLLKKAVERNGISIELKRRVENQRDIEGFDAVLVAVGREPEIPEGTEVARDDRGFIKVDQCYQTDIKGIFAIGDVTGPPLLAHRASHQGKRLATHLCRGGFFEPGPIPAAVFTHPEYAWVGVNEGEVDGALIGRFPLTASGRAVAMGETDGLCKVIINSRDHRIIGGHILGPFASELIGILGLAIRSRIKLEELEETIQVHPTMAEMIPEALANALHRAIHID